MIFTFFFLLKQQSNWQPSHSQNYYQSQYNQSAQYYNTSMNANMQYDQYQNQMYAQQQQPPQMHSNVASVPSSFPNPAQINYNGDQRFEAYQKSAEQSVNSTKRTFDEMTKEVSTDEKDSPFLRALLSDKKAKRLRFSPNYSKVDIIENRTISPEHTESSLDKYAFEQRQSAEALKMTGANLIATSSITAQVTSIPLSTTTTPFTNHTVTSPMSKYVEGISTPPLSPKEAEHVNQTSKACDASSSDTNTWIQNDTDCKYFPLF